MPVPHDTVRLVGVSTGYRQGHGPPRVVTAAIDAGLRTAELTCLLGPNGAGKSTLMRTIAAMQPPLTGSITIEDRDVTRLSARELASVVSVVLTERTVPSMLSAYALVALGRHPHTNWIGDLTDADHLVVREAMAMTGAGELADRLVAELSDGERQRVMVARALAQQPHVMVLDEITAFLDLPGRVRMMRMLRQLAHDTGRAMLLSTHDLELALRASDRLWLLPKSGSLVVGAPEDLVLSGAFESTFAGEGIQFDPEQGSFHVRTTPRGCVSVSGSGVPRVWTVRALERVGYRVTDDSAAVRVIVRNGDEGLAWRIDVDSGIDCSSIEHLINRLATTPE